MHDENGTTPVIWAMLGDKSRREAERKRSEALIAQITGSAPADGMHSLQTHGARNPSQYSSVGGGTTSPIAQRPSDNTAESTPAPALDRGPAIQSVMSPERIRFNRYDLDRDGALDRAEVRAFLRGQKGIDMRTLSRPGIMADAMRDCGHNGVVRLENFSKLVAFAEGLSSGAQTRVAATIDASATEAVSDVLSTVGRLGGAANIAASAEGESNVPNTARAADNAQSDAAALFEEKRAARHAHEAAERVASLVPPAHQQAYYRLRADWSKSGGQAQASTSSLQQLKDASERAKRRARMQRDFAEACGRNRQPKLVATGEGGTGGSSSNIGALPSAQESVRQSASTRNPTSSVMGVSESNKRPEPSASLKPSRSLQLRREHSFGSTSMVIGMADDSGWELQLSPTGTSLTLPGAYTPESTRAENSLHQNRRQLYPRQRLGAVPQHRPLALGGASG